MTEDPTTDLPDDFAPHTPHARQLLVLPDRDAAEEAAEELSADHPDLGELDIVRDALAGEDDAEDAQWLVVVEPPEDGWPPALLRALDTVAASHEGWREES
ncbi:hypothetical protein [Kitasatospora sp. NPDC056184]|uniref:hypothetical protein n=1 Tax=Kitasatospora sp. NPDC056184 TaxID=3345738 RepID=UPI0035D5FCF6